MAVRELCKNPPTTAVAASLFNNPHALGYRGLMTTHVQVRTSQPDPLVNAAGRPDLPLPLPRPLLAPAGRLKLLPNRCRSYASSAHRTQFKTARYVAHDPPAGRLNLASVAQQHGHHELAAFLLQAIADFHKQEQFLKAKETNADLCARRLRQKETLYHSRMKAMVHI